MLQKTIVRTADAPAPIGPYNQAVWAGDLLFVSGQIALDPATGQLIEGSVADEAALVMKNLEAILSTAGTGFAQVVKTTIFLMDMADFATVNECYGRFFEEGQAPARETVQVSGLPRGVRVEISMIAVRP